MADLEAARIDPERQMWNEIEGVSAGMLGLEASPQHFQPMAPHVDRTGRRIWFFTKRSSDLVRALEGAQRASFIVVGKRHDYHASLSGSLMESYSEAVRDAYWSRVVAAWFHGKNDPELTLLEFVPEDAAIWASSSSSLTFGWEIAKANLKGNEPDLGVRTHVVFRSAA